MMLDSLLVQSACEDEIKISNSFTTSIPLQDQMLLVHVPFGRHGEIVATGTCHGSTTTSFTTKLGLKMYRYLTIAGPRDFQHLLVTESTSVATVSGKFFPHEDDK